MKRINSDRESGIALISVLALLSTVGMLTAAAVMLSQYAAAEVSSLVELKKSPYRLESAVNRAILLLRQDRRLNGNRLLGTAEDRFMADGVRHELDIYGVGIQLQVHDGNSGWDVSGNAPSRQLQSLADSAADHEKLVSLSNRIMDYVDRDDLVRLNGMEAPQYGLAGIPVLPRNRPMQFREEILWIPGGREFFPPGSAGRLDWLRPIAPAKLKPLSGRPNLYAVPTELISLVCRLTGAEELLLENAFREWRENRRPLAESLPPNIYGKVSGSFSSRESGIYRITASGADEEGGGLQLTATLSLGAGPLRLEYYEFFYH